MRASVSENRVEAERGGGVLAIAARILRVKWQKKSGVLLL